MKQIQGFVLRQGCQQKGPQNTAGQELPDTHSQHHQGDGQIDPVTVEQ